MSSIAIIFADGCLDGFTVELYNDTEESELCSMFPKASLGEGKEMRVNCLSRLAKRVRILSSKDVGFSIAEIEVFTLG